MSVFVTLSLFTNKGTMMTEKQKRIQCKEDGCRKLADPCHFICDMHLRESIKSDDDEEDDEDEEDEPKEPVIDPQAIMLKVQAGEAVEADLIVPLFKEWASLKNVFSQIHAASKQHSEEHTMLKEIARVTGIFQK